MANLKINLYKLMLIHFIVSISILLAGAAGLSHRSAAALSIIQLPLYVWPIWFFFLGKGWKRIIVIPVAAFVSFIMLLGFLLKDENILSKRRFTTSLGQIYVVTQFDFDRSEELPDQITLEKPLPFGFVKTLTYYQHKISSIGKIHEVKSQNNSLELRGDWGSYRFLHDGSQLQLIN